MISPALAAMYGALMSPLPVVQNGRAKPPAAGPEAFLPTGADELRARGWARSTCCS